MAEVETMEYRPLLGSDSCRGLSPAGYELGPLRGKRSRCVAPRPYQGLAPPAGYEPRPLRGGMPAGLVVTRLRATDRPGAHCALELVNPSGRGDPVFAVP